MKKQKKIRCDYPGCESFDARKFAIKTNEFRGDDVFFCACKKHRAEEYHLELLKTKLNF